MSKTPKLRFKEFSGDWEEKKLGEFLTESKVKGSTGEDSKKLTVKLWGKGIVPKKDILQGSAETQYYIRRAGQLMYGKLDFLNCAFGIVPDYLDGYESTLDAPAFDVKNANINFILMKIIQRNFYKKYGDIADGSRKAKRVHVGTFLDMPIRIPSIEEQDKIVSLVSLINKKISLQGEKVEALNDYKKGIMQKIFSRELRFKDDDGRDYAEWEEKKLGDIFSFQYGQFNNNPNNGGKYPIYGANGIIGGYHEYNAEKSVIIGHMGAYAGIVLWEEKKHFVTYNGTIGKPKDNQTLTPKFGYYMLLNKNIPRICAGSGQPFLSYNDLNKIKVICPKDILEQEKIANFLTSIDNKIDKEQEKLDSLNEYKKGLLQQMFV